MVDDPLPLDPVVHRSELPRELGAHQAAVAAQRVVGREEVPVRETDRLSHRHPQPVAALHPHPVDPGLALPHGAHGGEDEERLRPARRAVAARVTRPDGRCRAHDGVDREDREARGPEVVVRPPHQEDPPSRPGGLLHHLDVPVAPVLLEHRAVARVELPQHRREHQVVREDGPQAPSSVLAPGHERAEGEPGLAVHVVPEAARPRRLVDEPQRPVGLEAVELALRAVLRVQMDEDLAPPVPVHVGEEHGQVACVEPGRLRGHRPREGEAEVVPEQEPPGRVEDDEALVSQAPRRGLADVRDTRPRGRLACAERPRRDHDRGRARQQHAQADPVPLPQGAGTACGRGGHHRGSGCDVLGRARLGLTGVVLPGLQTPVGGAQPAVDLVPKGVHDLAALSAHAVDGQAVELLPALDGAGALAQVEGDLLPAVQPSGVCGEARAHGGIARARAGRPRARRV